MRTCSEASNNSIALFDIGNGDNFVDGLRILCARGPPLEQHHHRNPFNMMLARFSTARGCESCAPHARSLRAAVAVASGSGSLRRDLRNNVLESFPVWDFLGRAVQLEKLYAAAYSRVRCAHLGTVGGRAGSSAATSCTAARTRAIAGNSRRSRSGRRRRRCTLQSPPPPPPHPDR